ncbi:LamG-like jellyroll fold domain-containing protein [Prosthecobacter sp.]|uniref:LamG-like jellyroll fold domain-containing protein n=1 Tax=Prosthecobacter sp. TaxID=1965333 RepID=UPI002AB85622|nr:LamG-like jellyroll fold domain-containing protein [Prosthecobacter sp.]MDZ4403693.1 LamG-like jellyroll fold domain-containing protein [Prosthecobacter sp.]
MKPLVIFLCLASPLLAQDSLKSSLVFHASFDSSLNADFSKGSKDCVIKKGKDFVPCVPNDDVKLAAGGKFGGCVHFPKKGVTRPQFNGMNVLGYNDKSWSATVSVWLRLTPDEDLEPGYCDPVQITGDDVKKGYIFLEFSKDETPRFFRYAVRPLFHIWNPTNVQWADIPFEKRPMVQVAKPPFTRDTWTHVVFTLSNVNNKAGKSSGSLFLNGKLQGRIENWDLSFGWDPASVALVLGASYVGHQDDLAVFDRALTDAEVERLFKMEGGVTSLR